MNERIKELLGQARLFCYDDGTVSLMGETYCGQQEIEKFAQLIVRECADIAFAQANHYAETQNKGSAMSAADCIGRLIKIEFGVE
jgi:hypothetical protein